MNKILTLNHLIGIREFIVALYLILLQMPYKALATYQLKTLTSEKIYNQVIHNEIVLVQ